MVVVTQKVFTQTFICEYMYILLNVFDSSSIWPISAITHLWDAHHIYMHISCNDKTILADYVDHNFAFTLSFLLLSSQSWQMHFIFMSMQSVPHLCACVFAHDMLCWINPPESFTIQQTTKWNSVKKWQIVIALPGIVMDRSELSVQWTRDDQHSIEGSIVFGLLSTEYGTETLSNWRRICIVTLCKISAIFRSFY